MRVWPWEVCPSALPQRVRVRAVHVWRLPSLPCGNPAASMDGKKTVELGRRLCGVGMFNQLSVVMVGAT
jgi:hypothetical protein